MNVKMITVVQKLICEASPRGDIYTQVARQKVNVMFVVTFWAFFPVNDAHHYGFQKSAISWIYTRMFDMMSFLHPLNYIILFDQPYFESCSQSQTRKYHHQIASQCDSVFFDEMS